MTPFSDSLLECRKPSAGLADTARWELVKLVQRLFCAPDLRVPRLVVLSGLEAKNQSGWVAACASEILAANVDGRVCLVDANLRHPIVHEHFGIANHHGFTDAVSGAGSVLEFTSQVSRNLWLLTSGSSRADIDALFTAERLRPCLQELRAEFDYVLIDAPASGLYNDAAMVGQVADGMVLVLGAHSTRRDAAQNVRDDLAQANVQILGVVLYDGTTNGTSRIPQANYSKLRSVSS